MEMTPRCFPGVEAPIRILDEDVVNTVLVGRAVDTIVIRITACLCLYHALDGLSEIHRVGRVRELTRCCNCVIRVRRKRVRRYLWGADRRVVCPDGKQAGFMDPPTGRVSFGSDVVAVFACLDVFFETLDASSTADHFVLDRGDVEFNVTACSEPCFDARRVFRAVRPALERFLYPAVCEPYLVVVRDHRALRFCRGRADL